MTQAFKAPYRLINWGISFMWTLYIVPGSCLILLLTDFSSFQKSFQKKKKNVKGREARNKIIKYSQGRFVDVSTYNTGHTVKPHWLWRWRLFSATETNWAGKILMLIPLYSRHSSCSERKYTLEHIHLTFTAKGVLFFAPPGVCWTCSVITASSAWACMPLPPCQEPSYPDSFWVVTSVSMKHGRARLTAFSSNTAEMYIPMQRIAKEVTKQGWGARLSFSGIIWNQPRWCRRQYLALVGNAAIYRLVKIPLLPSLCGPKRVGVRYRTKNFGAAWGEGGTRVIRVTC